MRFLLAGGMLQDKLYSKILRSGDDVKENIQNPVLQISPAHLRHVMINRFMKFIHQQMHSVLNLTKF